MPEICRIGDSHACGATDVGGSGDVFANGLGVHRVGDAEDGGHGSVQVGGSPNVFVNGISVARVGDACSDCPVPPHAGTPQVTGSPNVWVN